MIKNGLKYIDNPKIINVMADGTIRDSMEGYVIPYNEKTKSIYEFLVQKSIEISKESPT